ncbi:MAG: hypothetical protein QOH05_886, partial [Acetobacteraceae bacterium]|nr:hypothetical protein [Acetobacteraceae bacterium]
MILDIKHSDNRIGASTALKEATG